MAQLITVRLSKSDQQPLGFRLQGGKDFGTPLVVQKVNGGSAAERAGLQAGDALIRVNNTDVYALRHQEAQDAIRAAGIALELTVQRGGGTWKPSITSTGSLPRPGSRPLGSSPVPVTNTSLKATPQPTRAFGSGHNNVAKPFGYMNGNDSVKSIVNKQYNTPVNMYSDKTIAETLSAQTEVLAGGVLGVNFKKNEKSYDAEKSAVFKVLQEEQNDPEPVSEVSAGAPTPVTPVSGLRHVAAPVARPDAPLNTGGLPHGQNICEECERLITGVFVRIKDKNLHVECFKCATCGSALKNQGYYNLNGKLYCDIHAKLVARQNPPASNLEPVTVPPASRIPSNAYSTPLPPLATNNYTNGSSSMFSPSSNLSGPKPFGSSIGSAYSPASLSPRSAPLSPARPLAAPAPAPAPAPAHAHAPAPAFAPTKNVKSIVWPPPNPPEDEPQSELNTNTIQNIHYSDSTSMAQEPIMMSITTDFNPKNIMKPPVENVLSTESTGFSSNIAMSTSQATSITESLVQSQKSQMMQEMSSCTVQSFSQQATSESQSYSMFQTHKASDQMNSEMTKKMTPNIFSMQDKQNIQSKNTATVFYPENKSTPNKIENTVKDESSKKSTAFDQKYNPKTKTFTPGKFESIKSTNASHKKNIQSKSTCDNKPANINQSADVIKSPMGINRLSLLDALTIAPDRPYSPLSFNIPQFISTSSNENYQENVDIITPITTLKQSDNSIATSQSEQYITVTSQPERNILAHAPSQTTSILQAGHTESAFKPVRKQVFPPPQPQEFSLVTENIQNQKESKSFENTTTISSLSFSPAKSVQSSEIYSKTESLNTGLHRPETIPPYQQNLEYLASHSGQTPDLYSVPSDPHNIATTVERKMECQSDTLISNQHESQGLNSIQASAIKIKHKDSSIPFQPVLDETMATNSPVFSRPTTPSMINKPAPIIPRYQMNLVTVEHSAPEGRMYKPQATDNTQSTSPKPRPRSPAPGPQSNPLKAHAPRIKENTSTCISSQDNSIKKDQELIMYGNQGSNVTKWLQDQPITKQEMQSNVEYHSESYNKGDMKIKEDSMVNQNYNQRQMESQNILEHGNTTIQTTKKTFEEFERAQSAKVIEIHHGGSHSSGSCPQIQSNIQKPNDLIQVYPPPIMETTPSQQNLTFNTTNENFATASKQSEIYQPIPFVSGANKGPVCDPTPSTGSGVGVSARGKAFGVSSAPKRGRGVLNKAALPGSRIPLCGCCNGQIRGPFITALGRIWCPEHFVCVNTTCRRQLQDIGFVEENGQLYCEYCFEQYIAPACNKCHAKIKGDCLNAIGKHFHPECFSCVYCGKLFGNNPFFLEDGLPYCEADWNELFTTKCFACGFPVEAGDRWVEALNNNYHSQCFNCTVCKKNLEGQSFFARGGRPFCKIHAR